MILWAVFLVSGPTIGFGRMIQIDAIRNLFSPDKKIWVFAAAQVAEVPVQRLFYSLVIPVLTVIAALMIITYVPQVSLFLRDIIL